MRRESVGIHSEEGVVAETVGRGFLGIHSEKGRIVGMLQLHRRGDVGINIEHLQ